MNGVHVYNHTGSQEWPQDTEKAKKWIVVIRILKDGSNLILTGRSSTSLSIKENTSLKTRENARISDNAKQRGYRGNRGTFDQGLNQGDIWRHSTLLERVPRIDLPIYSGGRSEQGGPWWRDLSLTRTPQVDLPI